MKQRKNIALIGVGIIGIPVLSEILQRISQEADVTIYSFIPLEKDCVPVGIRVRYLPRKIHQRIKYCLLGARFVVDHFTRPYDVVHAQSAFPGGILARALGKVFKIPWMVTLIGGEVEAVPTIPFGDLLNVKLKKPTIRVCAEARILTVMSGYQAQSVRNNLGIQRDIKVLPYAPTVGPLDEKSITHPVKLLHVGFHHPVKNQRMLLDTAAKLAGKIPFKLTIIGANYGEEFRRSIRDLNLEELVDIKGTQTYAQMQQHYREAHMLIHTSWYEGLPTVAFEAMASGTVVCGTHVGILADFSGRFCRTVDPGDDARLASVILEIANDPTQFAQLRRDAYNWAQANDCSFYVREMLEIYQALAGQGR
jgi:glycosyltransferase involved in cell wall biosynthesis